MKNYAHMLHSIKKNSTFSLKDRGMTCNFMSFSTVFQSYQDHGWVIMKGCMQWNLVYGWNEYHLKWGSDPGLLDQLTSS